MIDEDVDSYLHALHCLMTAAYYLKDLSTFSATRKQLEAFLQKSDQQLNKNSQILAFLYRHLAALNQNFMAMDLKENVPLIHALDKDIRKYQSLLDPHKVHLLYYKMAWTHLANGSPESAIDYLQIIINSQSHLRDDILIYTWFQLFMAHFELRNLEISEYLLSAVARRIGRSKTENLMQKLCLRHFRKLSSAGPFDREAKLRTFRDEIEMLQKDPFQRRDFLYLHVPLWIESQLKKKPMADC